VPVIARRRFFKARLVLMHFMEIDQERVVRPYGALMIHCGDPI
jgi:hypothetical protein